MIAVKNMNSFSPRRPVFVPSSVHFFFVCGRSVTGTSFFGQVPRFSTPAPLYERWMLGLLATQFNRDIVSPRRHTDRRDVANSLFHCFSVVFNPAVGTAFLNNQSIDQSVDKDTFSDCFVL